MPIYHGILRAIGLQWIFDSSIHGFKNNNNEPNIVVDIESGNAVNIREDDNNVYWCTKYTKFIMNCIYSVFVGIIILWPCIYTIYKAASVQEVRYFTSNIFKFLFVIQYILGILYYQNKHFKKHKVGFGLDLKKEMYMNIGFVLNVVVSIGLGAATIALVVTGANMNIYSDLYTGKTVVQQAFICILLFITQFYSYSTFISNTIIFSATFINHAMKVQAHLGKLKTFIKIRDMTIMDIITEFGVLKSGYRKSVNKMNNIFTSLLILGLASIYFVIINFNTMFNSVFNYVEIGILLINVASYMMSLSRVRRHIEDIGFVVNSVDFNAVFLNREQFVELSGDIPMSDMQMDETLEAVPLNDTDSSPAHDIDRMRKTIEKSKTINNSDSVTIGFIKEVVLRSMIRDSENSHSNDWQILSTKLSQPWEYFRLFGYEVYDYVIVSKLTAMGLLFYGALGLGNKFGLTI